MSEMTLQSPLAPILGAGPRTLQVDGHAVALGECPLMDMLNLRGNPQDPALQHQLPPQVGRVQLLHAVEHVQQLRG